MSRFASQLIGRLIARDPCPRYRNLLSWCAAGLMLIAAAGCAGHRREPVGPTSGEPAPFAELSSERGAEDEEAEEDEVQKVAEAEEAKGPREERPDDERSAGRRPAPSQALPPEGDDDESDHREPDQRETDQRAEPDPPRGVRPFDDILVLPDQQRVEIRAWVCLDVGFLEQIACSPGTREHEALVVIRAEANHIHAALLLAGFEPGRPGEWIWHAEEREVELIAPEGDAVDVWVRYDREDAERIVEPIRRWIRDHHGNHEAFPDEPWIFGGSRFEENPEWMGPGEHYVADITGSLIGLVTFGDEILGYREVISDAAAVHEPEWEVDPDRIPPLETEVTIIIQPRGADAPPKRGPDEDDGDVSAE